MFSTNLSTIKLIGYCLAANRLDNSTMAKLSKSLTSKNFDWKNFCHVAATNWLLSYLHYELQRKNLINLVPQQVQAELLAVRHLAGLRNRRIKQQLEQVLGLLNQENIQPLLLKGASYLMEPVSQVQQFRMISDIDLLIDESSIIPAVKLLKLHGYSFSNFLPDGTNYHLDPMFKNDMPARLELHVKPLAAGCSQMISVDSAWDNAELMKNDSLGYFIFIPEYRLIHQFAHAQMHSGDHANERIDLRQLYDFHIMCHIYSESIDWSSLDRFYSTHGRQIWIDYILMARLVFSNCNRSSISGGIAQQAHAKKILLKSSGDRKRAYLYHCLERLTRLPKRLTSPEWYTIKFRTLFNR